MRPHISGTEWIGFSKQDAFRLLPKVSGANVLWVNMNHTFLTHKNPWTDTSSRDISLAKLHSTARDGIPKGLPHRELGWLSCSSRFAWSDSAGLPHYENLCSGILNVPLTYGMRLKVSPEGRHIFEQLLGFHVRRVVHWWYCSCMWLPCAKKKEGANTITRRVAGETSYSWTKKKSGSWRCAMMSPVSLTGAATARQWQVW